MTRFERKSNHNTGVKRGAEHLKQLTAGNRRLVLALEMDPCSTVGELSQKLGISEAATRKRLLRLLKGGVIRPAYSVLPEYSGMDAQVFVSLKVTLAKLRHKKGKPYNDLKEFVSFIRLQLKHTQEWEVFFRSRGEGTLSIVDCVSVAGGGMGTDVIVVLLGTSESILREFVTEVIGTLNGVDETNTAVAVY